MIRALLVSICIVAMLLVALAMYLSNDSWKKNCTENLNGNITSNQQVCLSDDGRILDMRG